MDTHDSTVKLARAVQVGDTLVAVERNGERLCQVREVTQDRGRVTIVTSEQTVTLGARDAVRVSHPDVPLLNPAHSTFPTSA